MYETDPRHVALEGALDVRDLGGYPTRDGHRVRWWRLYRAAELCASDDLPIMDRLGLRTVYDLRSTRERCERPNRRWNTSSVRYLHRDYGNANLAAMMRGAVQGADRLRRSILALRAQLLQS